MPRIEFGNTWWGEKWLDALTVIDCENRLPRGKSYARNGSVSSITIAGAIVRATVQGSQRQPYRVAITLPVFTKKEQRIVLDTIARNTLFLSYLLSRKLPTALYHELQESNIQLFPRRWRDVKAQCSYPDWAVPCKHIAAVIYLIANEIDKNPFLVFELHEFQIFNVLDTHGLAKEQAIHTHIVSVNDIIRRCEQPAKHLHNEDTADTIKKICTIDFSLIPDIKEHILSLVSERPLFYPGGDFKSQLKLMYRKLSPQCIPSPSAHDEHQPFPRDTEQYTNVIITLDRSLEIELFTITTREGKYTIDAARDHSRLIDYLSTISYATLERHSDSVIALFVVFRFAVRLAEQGATIPQLVHIGENEYRIRWIPALMNEQVKRAFDQLVAGIPPALVGIRNRAPKRSTARSANNDSKKYRTTIPVPSEQVLLLTSFFLRLFIKTATGGLSEGARDHMTDIFFSGALLKADSFETHELPQTINGWLSKFFIAHKECVPLLKVEAEGTTFTVEVFAEYTKKNLEKPIPLRDVFEREQHHGIRADMMRDLMMLSEQFPALETVIAKKGGVLTFNSKEFADVLFTALPSIKMLGVQILLPKALQELIIPKLSLSLAKKKTAARAIKSYLSLEDMLSFDWRVALADQCIDAAEFRKLVARARGIIMFKDRYVYVDDKDVQRILEGMEKKPRLSAHDLFKTALSGAYGAAPIEISDETIALIRSLLDLEMIPPPASMTASLRPYQERGYWWLVKNARVGFGSLIADDMGLGKTVQVIATVARLKEDGLFVRHPVLVVVPTTLLTNWQREIKKFAPHLQTHIYHGGARTAEERRADCVITTYGMVRKEVKTFSKKQWSCLIIDEAQNIKNAETAQAKAIKSIAAPIKIAMTGTPVENHLGEYWSIMDFLNKGYLGDQKTFREDVAEPIELNRDQAALERFRMVTSPFILRRVKTDTSIIHDLPKKNEIDQFCALTREQASLYTSTVDTIMRRIESAEGIERRGLIFKLMTALKQICNHPSQYLKKKTARPELSGKTALLLDLLGTIYENDEKVLLFTQYTQMGDLLQKMLDERFKSEVLFLHGGVTRAKRDEMVDRFGNERQINAMILSLKAGGTGLNLTAATNVIHVDLWWNPAVEQQATDRAYRIGQTKNVMVYRMITKDTFEEKINAMIQAKKELADLTVAKGEKWIGEFSNTELKTLFQMDPT
ncbi:DEAD/DEAH box helicase [Candidatus Uhrbacteria bacterium]|nr:DEAD/DEAH box helicase [Candidatus Uhrbacteria bacterium]